MRINEVSENSTGYFGERKYMGAYFNLHTGADYEIAIHQLNNKSYPTLHWHSGIEIELMLDGSAVHFFNGYQYTISRGEIWYSNYDTYHSFINCDCMVIAHALFRENLIPEEIRNRLLSVKTGFFRLSEEECMATERLFNKMIDAKNSNDAYATYYISAILTQMIIECMKHVSLPEASSFSSSSSSLSSKALSLIHCHFREDISLQKTASMLAVNANYLGRLFLKTTGQSFSEYLTALRMQYALSLLCNTNLSIKEIAFDCGYRSVEYFYASFKKYFGNSPANVRKLK